jgi:16S rRNA (uracil1498-N3)-methyltransferase
MPRFYCPQGLSLGSRIDLPDNVVRHLHVLRAAAGDSIVLFNGQGDEGQARLATLEKRSATAEITASIGNDTELPYKVELAQALPEGSKMDWIIEKAVELGVSSIQPLAAQRSVVKLTPERAAKRQQHWEGIIIAASEQSGRTRLARIAEVTDLARWQAPAKSPTRLLLTPRASDSLGEWAKAHAAQDIVLVVGPEGGYNDHEEKLLIDRGATPVSMGARILRTETAGLAAIAAINSIWGQM